MDKGIAGLEMNSCMKQRRVKKSFKNCSVLSVISLKHKYESVAGIRSELLYGLIIINISLFNVDAKNKVKNYNIKELKEILA